MMISQIGWAFACVLPQGKGVASVPSVQRKGSCGCEGHFGPPRTT